MAGNVSAIDVASRKEITRIPVGQTVPKRIEAVVLP
jgi:YVTN family beta-propeller protein